MNKPGPRQPRVLTLTALATALTWTLSAQPVLAQTTDAAKPNAGLERAQKAADAVFHWIKLNGEKGASRQTPAPAPAAAPAPAPAPASPPAPRKPIQAAAPRPAPAVPAPAPEPAAVAVAESTLTPPPPAAPAAMAAAEPEPERGPLVVAAVAPSPTPAAPLAAAEHIAQPAPAPAEPEEVQLKLLNKVEPAIPRQLLTQVIRNGYAQVQFTVSPDGSVSKAQVMRASHVRLGNAAVDAIKQWRFAPIARAREAAVQVAFNNEVE